MKVLNLKSNPDNIKGVYDVVNVGKRFRAGYYKTEDNEIWRVCNNVSYNYGLGTAYDDPYAFKVDEDEEHWYKKNADLSKIETIEIKIDE